MSRYYGVLPLSTSSRRQNALETRLTAFVSVQESGTNEITNKTSMQRVLLTDISQFTLPRKTELSTVYTSNNEANKTFFLRNLSVSYLENIEYQTPVISLLL